MAIDREYPIVTKFKELSNAGFHLYPIFPDVNTNMPTLIYDDHDPLGDNRYRFLKLDPLELYGLAVLPWFYKKIPLPYYVITITNMERFINTFNTIINSILEKTMTVYLNGKPKFIFLNCGRLIQVKVKEKQALFKKIGCTITSINHPIPVWTTPLPTKNKTLYEIKNLGVFGKFLPWDYLDLREGKFCEDKDFTFQKLIKERAKFIDPPKTKDLPKNPLVRFDKAKKSFLRNHIARCFAYLECFQGIKNITFHDKNIFKADCRCGQQSEIKFGEELFRYSCPNIECPFFIRPKFIKFTQLSVLMRDKVPEIKPYFIPYHNHLKEQGF